MKRDWFNRLRRLEMAIAAAPPGIEEIEVIGESEDGTKRLLSLSRKIDGVWVEVTGEDGETSTG